MNQGDSTKNMLTNHRRSTTPNNSQLKMRDSNTKGARPKSTTQNSRRVGATQPSRTMNTLARLMQTQDLQKF